MNVDWLDIVTAIVAILGLLLSVFNFISDRRKSKKKVKVIVEVLHWSASARLKIVNSEYRPITITSVQVQFPSSLEIVPANAMLDIESEKKLPRRLEEGESIILQFGSVVGELIFASEGDFDVIVYDGENRIHRVTSVVFFDEKYNYYVHVPNSWISKLKKKST